MKRWLSLAAIAVLCLALVIGIACGGGGGEDEDEGVTEVKLGLGLPLSGILGALVGTPSKQADELMAERIGVFEVGGKQYRWKLIFEDNEGSSAAGGMASTTKFIYTDHVDIVLQNGVAARTAQTLCEESGVLFDAGSTTFDAFGPDHPLTIQTGPSMIPGLAAFYDYIAKEHPEVERIVITSLQDALAVAFAEAIESNMHEYFGFEREIVLVATTSTEPYPIATAIMAEDPDLFISAPGTAVLDVMWDMGYEGLAAQIGMVLDQSQFEAAGWDDCKGMMFFWPEWYGAEGAGVWPEAVAIAGEYEARYGVDMPSGAFAGCVVLEILTGALQQAGTVDDVEVIMEAIKSGTPIDTIVGPVYFGGEGFVGTNCLAMWPVAIWEVIGEREYELLDYYTAEEAEAIGLEVWTATMP